MELRLLEKGKRRVLRPQSLCIKGAKPLKTVLLFEEKPKRIPVMSKNRGNGRKKVRGGEKSFISVESVNSLQEGITFSVGRGENCLGICPWIDRE